MKRTNHLKRNAIAIFIVFIMVSSGIGYMFGESAARKEKYKEYTFVLRENQWVTEIEGKEIGFNYLPQDVENIDVNEEIVSGLQNKLEIDVTSGINDSFSEGIALAEYFMDRNLASLNVYLRKGFTANNTYGAPIITCNDATDAVPVVFFKKGEQTAIYLNNGCIISEIRSERDALIVADRLMYGMVGVI